MSMLTSVVSPSTVIVPSNSDVRLIPNVVISRDWKSAMNSGSSVLPMEANVNCQYASQENKTRDRMQVGHGQTVMLSRRM